MFYWIAGSHNSHSEFPTKCSQLKLTSNKTQFELCLAPNVCPVWLPARHSNLQWRMWENTYTITVCILKQLHGKNRHIRQAFSKLWTVREIRTMWRVNGYLPTGLPPQSRRRTGQRRVPSTLWSSPCEFVFSTGHAETRRFFVSYTCRLVLKAKADCQRSRVTDYSKCSVIVTAILCQETPQSRLQRGVSLY